MSEPDLQAAIERIETSRQTHVDWRDYWLGIPDHADCDGCKATADIAGDLDRQVRVIAEYDNVLAVLRDVSAAATRALAEERERIAQAHPVTVTRHCGNRLAEPVKPPPGPPSPPEWCAREADHEGECVTDDGWRLSGFVRAGIGIEQRPAVVTYRCQTCQTQQDTKSPTPCDTLRIARESR